MKKLVNVFIENCGWVPFEYQYRVHHVENGELENPKTLNQVLGEIDGTYISMDTPNSHLGNDKDSLHIWDYKNMIGRSSCEIPAKTIGDCIYRLATGKLGSIWQFWGRIVFDEFEPGDFHFDWNNKMLEAHTQTLLLSNL
jgi:hypothetical protein